MYLFSAWSGGLWSHCQESIIQNTEDMISTTQTAAVRCCSFDGKSCKSEIPDCVTLTFSKAQQKCSEFGMRLCTEKELDSEICCGTGCAFNTEMVWFTKGNMFCSFIRFLVQKRLFNFMLMCFLTFNAFQQKSQNKLTKVNSLVKSAPWDPR